MFISIIPGSITIQSFLVCELTAVVLGILTALAFSCRSRHSSSFLVSIALLPAIVTLVIMLVNGNIGAGLAVAGTFALVRFRSVQGSAREIAGLFMAVALGLACGMGYVFVAGLFFVMMAVLVVVLTLLRFGEMASSFRQLKVSIPENIEYEGLFDDLFERYTTRHELTRVKTSNMGTLYELTYSIYLKSADTPKAFIDEIRCRNGNLNISCSSYAEKDMM